MDRKWGDASTGCPLSGKGKLVEQRRLKFVILHGKRLTLADLPSPQTKRWVIRRKAEVVAAVLGGLLSLDDACERYNLTVEEFISWQRQMQRHRR
jgi:hypothetical protein